MAQGGAMESICIFAKFPLEVVELVLSFLSVPELCRMRSVCKSWKKIISKRSFHDLCDVNGRNDEYLFMWSERHRYDPHCKVVVNPIFSDTLSFLDVDARRWYSIPAADLPRVCGCGHEVESRFMAMDQGLVCELTTPKYCSEDNPTLAISDPVAKTRRILPTPPKVFLTPGQGPISSHILIAVDDASHSFKVFLLNNFSRTRSEKAQPRMYVHESFTTGWQGLRNIPNEVQKKLSRWRYGWKWASSAVVLHESLFILKEYSEYEFTYKLALFRYRFREDSWGKVYRMYFPRIISNSHLVVRSNRLFLNVWFGRSRSADPTVNPHASDPGLKSDPDCPTLEPLLSRFYPDTDPWFEMYEVLIDEYRRKPVVQLTCIQLDQIFQSDSRRDDFELDVSHAFPCVDSNGLCNCVLLVHSSCCIGLELRKYDLVTGSVDVLPQHPLVEPSYAKPGSEESIGEYFSVKNMKLSLRNLLAQRPKVTSTGWRLLQ